jgi:hypothetical protein
MNILHFKKKTLIILYFLIFNLKKKKTKTKTSLYEVVGQPHMELGWSHYPRSILG